jgi:Cys-tRNA(Pro)/Cys-tRNA(Cys) deacylase
MPAANNVTRMLDANRIEYAAFELPEEKLSALETAQLLGISPASIYKTIVVVRERSPGSLLILVPGTSVVDLKAVARAIGEKRVSLPTEREAEALTGLEVGGISPLALVNRGFRVLIDSAAESQPEIHVSGGRRGLNLRLRVSDLARVTGARFASVGTPAAGAPPAAQSVVSP